VGLYSSIGVLDRWIGVRKCFVNDHVGDRQKLLASGVTLLGLNRTMLVPPSGSRPYEMSARPVAGHGDVAGNVTRSITVARSLAYNVFVSPVVLLSLKSSSSAFFAALLPTQMILEKAARFDK